MLFSGHRFVVFYFTITSTMQYDNWISTNVMNEFVFKNLLQKYGFHLWNLFHSR